VAVRQVPSSPRNNRTSASRTVRCRCLRYHRCARCDGPRPVPLHLRRRPAGRYATGKGPHPTTRRSLHSSLLPADGRVASQVQDGCPCGYTYKKATRAQRPTAAAGPLTMAAELAHASGRQAPSGEDTRTCGAILAELAAHGDFLIRGTPDHGSQRSTGRRAD
jgi:hypothetical protein